MSDDTPATFTGCKARALKIADQVIKAIPPEEHQQLAGAKLVRDALAAAYL